MLRDKFYTSVLAPVQVMEPNDTFSVKMDQITFHPILPPVTPEIGRLRIASWQQYSSETETLNCQRTVAKL